MLQRSKSVKRISEIAKLTIDIDNNMLTCDTRSTDASGKLRCGAGVFHYDFALGVDFAESNQPVGFINVKKSIARHVVGETHQANLVRIGEESECLRKLAAKQQLIGITVGKQAYRLVKYGRPFADFEVDLLLLAHANAKIGNVNHSRTFPSELRLVFAKGIEDRLMECLAQPLDATSNLPPLGIVADNLTTRRRTGQMFAGILFTPGMPNRLTAVSLGVESVAKHDDDSIAEDIGSMHAKYKIQNDQIAGFGFDGQYLKLSKNVNFSWDPAHLLQLADKDMRKSISWVDSLCKDIGTVLSKFQCGKNCEAALDMAHNLGVDLKAPSRLSETRFASYAHKVFKNFSNNYGSVRRVLENIAASDNHQAKDADDLLCRIRTLEFVVKLLLCVDFYRALGVVSQTLQVVDIPFWTKQRRSNILRYVLVKWLKGKWTNYWNFIPTKQTCTNVSLLDCHLSKETSR